MAATKNDRLAASPFAALSAHLIDLHYRDIGCDGWNINRFHRLCGKLQKTEVELAALMRIKPAELVHRLRNGFTPQDGLILTMIEREIDLLHTGQKPEGLFAIVILQPDKAA